MPEIKFQHIVSFSSEDKVHKAENLLRPDTFRKWRSSSPGEKQASVVIQLEKSTSIHSVDIGNESSAFVEVLVGRSLDPSKDFEVLLVASSFMSPMESKNNTNTNRVRMFGLDKLSQSTANERWDLVKIVCTQPFNKSIQYGLSFIRLHSPPEATVTQNQSGSSQQIGSFHVKEDEDSDLNVGTWFAKRKEKSLSPSGAAAVREASSLAAKVLETSKGKDGAKADKVKLLKEKDLTVQKLKEQINIKTAKVLENSKTEDIVKPVGIQSSVKDKDQIIKNMQQQLNTKLHQRKEVKTSTEQTTTRKRKEEKHEISDDSATKKAKKNPKTEPFNKLMKKVVFVMSGFQNPLRGDIRDKALKMGAHYKQDWEKGCTHLICAFVNTPKYAQVKSAGGRIVTKDWILDCYKKQKLLPWRNFMLGQYQKDSTTEESDDEPDDSSAKSSKSPYKTADNTHKNIHTNNAVEKKEDTPKKGDKNSIKVTSSKESDEEYEASTDIDSDNTMDSDSGANTEDDLRKAQQEVDAVSNSSKQKSPNLQSRPHTTDLPLPELPDFFKNKCFFLYGSFTPDETYNLRRYIIAFRGTLSNYMDETVNFVVTKEAWDNNFNNALEENDQLIFVKPQWIYECKEKSKHVPFQRFVVVPT